MVISSLDWKQRGVRGGAQDRGWLSCLEKRGQVFTSLRGFNCQCVRARTRACMCMRACMCVTKRGGERGKQRGARVRILAWVRFS